MARMCKCPKGEASPRSFSRKICGNLCGYQYTAVRIYCHRNKLRQPRKPKARQAMLYINDKLKSQRYRVALQFEEGCFPLSKLNDAVGMITRDILQEASGLPQHVRQLHRCRGTQGRRFERKSPAALVAHA